MRYRQKMRRWIDVLKQSITVTNARVKDLENRVKKLEQESKHDKRRI